jgi:hypothetical protein
VTFGRGVTGEDAPRQDAVAAWVCTVLRRRGGRARGLPARATGTPLPEVVAGLGAVSWAGGTGGRVDPMRGIVSLLPTQRAMADVDSARGTVSLLPIQRAMAGADDDFWGAVTRGCLTYCLA